MARFSSEIEAAPIAIEHERAPKRKHTRRAFEPLGSLGARTYIALSIAGFTIVVGAWQLVASSGLVNPVFLPGPLSVVLAGAELFTQLGFLADVAATVYRVTAGFALAAVIAVPLGIFIGTFRPIEALFEPLISFVRYMPASAFVPLFILWIGLGDPAKMAVIFVGSFFSLTLMVAVVVRSTQRELLEAAYTLGANRLHVVRTVILPGALPGIYDGLRLTLGWAWTYIIVAEMVAADAGIGHRILESERTVQTSYILFGIVTIGVIGLVSDLVLKAIGERVFAWRAQ